MVHAVADYPYDELVQRSSVLDGYRPSPDPATGGWPLRDGTNPIERMALYRVIRDAAAMPPSLLVQIIFWKEQLADFARSIQRSPAVVYNTLGKTNGRPYHAVRQALADHLGVDKSDVDHLIDLPAAAPSSLLPTRAPGAREAPLHAPSARVYDSDDPPAVRDGSNPIERMAIFAMLANISAMPASMVVQIALWPANLNRFAEALHKDSGALYNMLAYRNGFVYPPLRRSLARALGVTVEAVAHLVEAPATESRSIQPGTPPASVLAAIKAAHAAVEQELGPSRPRLQPTRRRRTPAVQMSLSLS